jgi:hypothetical protein
MTIWTFVVVSDPSSQIRLVIEILGFVLVVVHPR